MRFFNTEGPVRPERHYCIQPLNRLDLDAILALIQEDRYFVLHAPRQTGKTSALLELADTLNSSGLYRCVYLNVEAGQAAREDIGAAMSDVLSELASRASEILQDDSVYAIWSGLPDGIGPGSALKEVLVRWSAADSKPVVLLVDEFDSLVGDSLISVLRQLRAGYDRRPVRFPQSVVLCGVRDVRDYRIHSSTEKAVVTGGSAFNVKAESLRLGDFSRGEIRALLAQHTAETGQAFSEDAIARLCDLTCGQPWLVNALARQACFRDKGGRDRGRAIDVLAINDAKEVLIQSRVTHLDQLADKLQEERVRRVIGPVLACATEHSYSIHDLEYVRDLGLVAHDDPVRIANPIYGEVVPRELTYAMQSGLTQETPRYLDPEGGLNMAGLLEAFQEFFRQHSEHWVKQFGYDEAGPLLVLQGFLQRLVNSGGRIEREYGLGRGRADLVVLWPQRHDGRLDGTRTHVVEGKVLREGLGVETVIEKGLEQTAWYMDRSGADSGHLLIFDLRRGKSWDDRLFRKEGVASGKSVTVWGM